jgi:hypothetical protein
LIKRNERGQFSLGNYSGKLFLPGGYTIECGVPCVIFFDLEAPGPPVLISLCKSCHNWVHSRENIDNEFIQ